MRNWKPDTIIARKLNDGFTYFGRLAEFPWVSFYKHRSKDSSAKIEEIVKSPILFTITAHKSLLKDWKPIGTAAPDPRIEVPQRQAIWEGPDECRIVELDDQDHPATPEECRDLEPAGVWEPGHVADRLQDTFAGRPNPWLEDLKSGF